MLFRSWKPNVTVAAVINREGRYLLVEEETDDGIRLNQPAGHLDENESLVEACARETLEESAWQFVPTALVGIYQWQRPQKDITYLRFVFAGTLGAFDAKRKLDDGILRSLWMTLEEVRNSQDRHRSPLVLQCIVDHQAGQRIPLTAINHYPS